MSERPETFVVVGDHAALQAARDEHFAEEADHEVWIVRTLDGLAVGLHCKPCAWRVWRQGWEPSSGQDREERQ